MIEHPVREVLKDKGDVDIEGIACSNTYSLSK